MKIRRLNLSSVANARIMLVPKLKRVTTEP